MNVKEIFKVGEKIRIISMSGEPQYAGREGVIEYVDDAGQLHGSWGGCAVILGQDLIEIIG